MRLNRIAVLLSGISLALGYESVEDAARIARTLIDLSLRAVSTMATVYPQDYPDLGGQPFSLQEYYASCHSNGSLSLLFLPISRHSQNILHHPTHAASISVWTDPPAARSPRVSLIGNVTILPLSDSSLNTEEIKERNEIKDCYLARHPDARWWLPGDDDGAHLSYWARFDPQSIYFVGGFGDKHYIGHVPLSLYQSAEPDPNLISELNKEDFGYAAGRTSPLRVQTGS